MGCPPRILTTGTAIIATAILASGCLYTGDSSDGDDRNPGDVSTMDTPQSDSTSSSDTSADGSTSDSLYGPVPDSLCNSNDKLTGLTDISAGNRTVCGIGNEGELICWGRSPGGLFDVPDGSTLAPSRVTTRQYDTVQLGTSHACALSGEQLYCWGNNTWNISYTHPDSSIGFQSKSGKGVVVPGSNAEQLNRPTQISIEGQFDQFTDIAVGKTHTCALLSDSGRAACWGADVLGQRGDGPPDGTSGNSSPSPSSFVKLADQMNPPLTSLRKIDAGAYHTCAAFNETTDSGQKGRVYCWGSNATPPQMGSSTFQTGQSDGYSDDKLHAEHFPFEVHQNFSNKHPIQRLDLAANSSCVIFNRGDDTGRQSDLMCWGDNTFSQIDPQRTGLVSDPVQTLNSQGINLSGTDPQLATGRGASCMSVNKQVLCWGERIIDKPSSGAGMIRSDTFDRSVIDLAIGTGSGGDNMFVCALTEGVRPIENQLYCWGSAAPTPTSSEHATPSRVSCSPS